jgi:hypothetical protein
MFALPYAFRLTTDGVSRPEIERWTLTIRTSWAFDTKTRHRQDHGTVTREDCLLPLVAPSAHDVFKLLAVEEEGDL